MISCHAAGDRQTLSGACLDNALHEKKRGRAEDELRRARTVYTRAKQSHDDTCDRYQLTGAQPCNKRVQKSAERLAAAAREFDSAYYANI